MSLGWFNSLLSAGVNTEFLISGNDLDFLNRYVLVYFYDGVYTSDGVNPVVSGDLSLAFNQNSGTATNATIASIKKLDNTPLTGGENVIRVNLTITGSPSGVELITITPSALGSIVDVFDNRIDPDDTTGPITLNLGYEQEYVDVLNYAISNTIDIPVDAQRTIDNTFVKNAKLAGAWTEWDRVYCTANNLSDRDFALINWKNPGTGNATASGSLSWTDRIGPKSDGSSYINTNYAPATHGSKFLQDDASVWIYVHDNVNSNNVTAGGRGLTSVGNNVGNVRLIPKNPSNLLRYILNRNTTTEATVANTNTGLFVLSRESSTSQKVYLNGSLLLNDAGVSSARSDKNIFVCAFNNNGTVGAFDTDRKVSFIAFGSGMQDILSDTNDIVQTWVTDTQTPPSRSGKLYLLAGQSNMAGVGVVSELPAYLQGEMSIANGKPSNCYVWWNNDWELLEAGVNASQSLKVGPIFSLAYEESEKYPGEDLYFVIQAVGGTSLAADWDPVTGVQYTTMLSAYSNAIATLSSYTPMAFYWSQGEADANSVINSAAYENNEIDFMTAVFTDTDFVTAIVVQLHDGLLNTYKDVVRDAKTANDGNSVYGALGSLISVDDQTIDPPHLYTAGYVVTGERMSVATP